MAVYNRSSSFIQVASQPERAFMYHAPEWCLSHTPRADCFVQHFCENKSSKRRMMQLYALPEVDAAAEDPLRRYSLCPSSYSPPLTLLLLYLLLFLHLLLLVAAMCISLPLLCCCDMSLAAFCRSLPCVCHREAVENAALEDVRVVELEIRAQE